MSAWATAEGISEQVLLSGLAIAADMLREYGLLEHELRQLDYRPEAAVAAIVARSGQGGWGDRDRAGEPEHEAALRAMRAAIAALCSDHQIEATVLAAIRAEFEGLSAVKRQVADIASGVGTLKSQMLASASEADVRIYLSRRARDWSQDAWHSTEVPVRPERRLNVVTRGRVTETLSDTQLLARFPHCVVLGGPGAGKSWLAKRIARDAAHAALRQLDEGASLSEVEIPLLTTWETWVHQSGTTRRSLVEAAFASGLGQSDLGGEAIISRMKQLLVDAPLAVVVIDALDEAKERDSLTGRMRDLAGLTGWRTMIMSRHAAWDEQVSGTEALGGVVELEPFTWTHDVVPFVRQWFSGQPDRADSLLSQLKRSPKLRSTSTVPLLLTFYCQYADEAPAGALLPANRRTLYSHIVRQLLRGGWSQVRPPLELLPAALHQLEEWAWEAVRTANNPDNGLGAWGESFTPASPPKMELARALDNVAPAMVHPGDVVVRAFRHRSLLEHLVGERVARLPTDEAAGILLPHLWFDADWRASVPGAIAAHGERDNLLDMLRRLAEGAKGRFGQEAANQELVRVLLEVAAETTPDDWNPANQEFLHQLRVRNATRYPEQAALSAQWRASNGHIFDQFLAAVPDGAAPAAALLETLPALDLSEHDRRRAAEAILLMLRSAGSADAVRMVEVLSALGPEEAERSAAVRLVIEKLHSAVTWERRRLVSALSTLGLHGAERRQVIEAFVVQLPTADLWAVDEAVTAHLGLGMDPGERQQLIAALTATLSDARPGDVSAATAGLRLLVLDESQLREVVQTALAMLPTARFGSFVRLGKALPGLGMSGELRQQFLGTILELMPKSESEVLADLLGVLPELALNGDERKHAVDVILPLLPTVRFDAAQAMVDVLPLLSGREPERRRVVEAVLGALDEGAASRLLVEALPRLVRGEDERRRAIKAIQRILPDSFDSQRVRAVTVMAKLGEEQERRQAIEIIVEVLSDASVHTVRESLWALPELISSEQDRVQAVEAVLIALSALPASGLGECAELLSALHLKETERRRVVQLLLAGLPAAPEWVLEDLLRALTIVGVNSSERRQALDELLPRLPDRFVGSSRRVAEALPVLCQDADERRRTVKAIVALLPSDNYWVVDRLVDVLPALGMEEAERRLAVEAILDVLPAGNAWALLEGLPPLLRGREERQRVARTLLHLQPSDPDPSLPRIVVRTARELVSANQWIDLLYNDA